MVRLRFLCTPEPPTSLDHRWGVGYLTDLERRIKTSPPLLQFLHLQAREVHEIIVMRFYPPFIRALQLAGQEMSVMQKLKTLIMQC